MLYLLDCYFMSCWGGGGFLISNIFEDGFEIMNSMQLFNQHSITHILN